MKKHIFLLSAVLALASLTYCHKEGSVPDAAQSSTTVKAGEAPVEEREDFCTNMIVLSDAAGMTLCCRPPNPNGQNNCTFCQFEYGSYYLTSNGPGFIPVYTPDRCFTLTNTSGAPRTVKFQVAPTDVNKCIQRYNFEPGQVRRFCINLVEGPGFLCCMVSESLTPCDG
jgi:hypothetical protein